MGCYWVFVEVANARPYNVSPSLVDRHSQDPEDCEAVGRLTGSDEKSGRVGLVLEVFDVAVVRGVAKHNVTKVRYALRGCTRSFVPALGFDGCVVDVPRDPLH